MDDLENIKKDLIRRGSKKKAKISAYYFKTGPGQYGAGDIFIGLTVPEQREIAKKYKDLDLKDVLSLLKSKEHEFRLTALMILVNRYETGNDLIKSKIFNLYLKNIKWVNNWDLVDSSASYIVGHYLFKRNKDILYTLVKSKNIWSRRISIVATHYFIRNNYFKDTIKISEILLKDKEDLIHKATGWMLREMGKKDIKVLEKFLSKHYMNIPRTMLRYSIEKFDLKTRKKYLNGEI